MLFQRDRRPGQIEMKIGQKEGEYSLTFTSSNRRMQPLPRLLLPDCRTAAIASWAGQARHDVASGAHDTRRPC